MLCQPADGANLMATEFPRRLTFAVSMTLLGDHVGHVILVSPEEEVPWIHTSRIVATMQDMEARWDRTICKLEGYAVCPKFAAPQNIALRVAADLSISISNTCAFPWPACVRIKTLHI